MKRKDKPDILGRIVSVVIPVLCFVGGVLLSGFHIAEQVATKPYVDDRFVEGKHYTDDKTAIVLKESFEHSDANKQSMLLEMEQMKTEIKAQEAATSAKVDLVLTTVQAMRDEDWKEVQRKRK